MKINILDGIEGAKKASGLTVIIDVFRVFSLEAYLINNQSKKLFVTNSIMIARNYKKNNKDTILIGERKGIKINGFDYGNSPSEIENIDFSNKTIVHTTSSGTKGIYLASNADEIIVASLVNAKAVSNYIKFKNPNTVSLVCMGNAGKTKTYEDNLCARYIKSLLLDEKIDINNEINILKTKDGKKFFNKNNQSVFPEKDFYLCTKINKFNFVLKVKKSNNLFYIEKSEINLT